MGNCVRKEVSTQWGGEDWSSPSPLAAAAEKQEEKGGFESSGAARREVKVKISKKQLQAVLGKADVDGSSSVHQLLADLMNAARHYEIETHNRHASWRPSLQTIPEL